MENNNMQGQNMNNMNNMNMNMQGQNMNNMPNQNMQNYNQSMQNPNMPNYNMPNQSMQGQNINNMPNYNQNMQNPNMPNYNQNMYGQNMNNMPNQNMQNPNMQGQSGYNQNMQQMNRNMNNMPPNMGGGYNRGYQRNAQDTMNKVFSALTKFTKDIDNIIQDFGDKVESVLNSGSLSNGTESINRTLEQAQNMGQGNQQGRVMEPVIGRSSIQLSNGNEVGVYENIQKDEVKNTYSDMVYDSNVQNIGQVANPEIHSVLDNKVSLDKNTESLNEFDLADNNKEVEQSSNFSDFDEFDLAGNSEEIEQPVSFGGFEGFDLEDDNNEIEQPVAQNMESELDISDGVSLKKAGDI